MDEIEQYLAMIEQYVLENGENIPQDLMNEFASFIEQVNLLTEEVTRSQQPEDDIGGGGSGGFNVPEAENLLWILSGGNPESFVRYLTTFPDDDFLPLLRDPQRLESTIQNLQSLNLINPRGESEGIPQADLQSSNIYGFNYDPKTRKMKVKFQGDGVYEYTGVPEFIFNIFQEGAIPAKTTGQNQYGRWWRGKSPSLGGSFYELIRLGGYPYQKIS